MKLYVLLLIGLTAGIVGCAEKEQAAAPEGSAAEATEPAVTEAPAEQEAPSVEEAAADEPDTTYAQIEDWRTEDLLDHMHAHAEQLDDLNFALDDGNLERAMTSAYWLSRHETVRGLPEDLQPFVDGMRTAARAVGDADDLAGARVAAERIGVECQGCHAATGVATQ